MKKKKYDFGGYVTKNDIKCTDGITIKHGAFADDDGKKVPLVWNHDHESGENVLGHVDLINKEDGVYGYGVFNNTENGKTAKELVAHGDIVAMSIFAKKLASKGSDLIHGAIKEVSLVMSGANPGATIDYVNVTHGDDMENGEAILTTGELIHTEIITEEPPVDPETQTVEQVLATMDETQLAAVGTLVDGLIEQKETNTEGENKVKHSVFKGKTTEETNQEGYLTHSEVVDIVAEARTSKASLKETFLAHGIIGLDILFPEAKTVDRSPQVYGNINTATNEILNGVRKVPFQNVKTIVADFTEDEARARGYITGDQKIEQVYSLMTRKTGPQTIYKLQKLDRDDIIDVEEYDIVAFTQSEMRHMLEEELARAILVGDGRAISDRSKIKQENIRSIKNDEDFYTMKMESESVEAMLEDIIIKLGEYRGSGNPTLYIQPTLLAKLKLIRAKDGRYLFGDIPSNEAMAARMGVSRIVPSTFFGIEEEWIITNLSDFTIGAAKGGQVTTFDDFDIDFNKYTYLIETRCSGALTLPKSAIYGKIKAAAGQ